jgi:hypothetical protein
MTDYFSLSLQSFVLYFKTHTFREECAQHLETPTQALQLVHPFESVVLAVIGGRVASHTSNGVLVEPLNGWLQ